MKVQFTTGAYVRSHMKEPKGRGSWAFEFEGCKDAWFTPGSLTLGEAKKAAVAEASRRAGPDGITTTVKILP